MAKYTKLIPKMFQQQHFKKNCKHHYNIYFRKLCGIKFRKDTIRYGENVCNFHFYHKLFCKWNGSDIQSEYPLFFLPMVSTKHWQTLGSDKLFYVHISLFGFFVWCCINHRKQHSKHSSAKVHSMGKIWFIRIKSVVGVLEVKIKTELEWW